MIAPVAPLPAQTRRQVRPLVNAEGGIAASNVSSANGRLSVLAYTAAGRWLGLCERIDADGSTGVTSRAALLVGRGTAQGRRSESGAPPVGLAARDVRPRIRRARAALATYRFQAGLPVHGRPCVGYSSAIPGLSGPMDSPHSPVNCNQNCHHGVINYCDDRGRLHANTRVRVTANQCTPTVCRPLTRLSGHPVSGSVTGHGYR